MDNELYEAINKHIESKGDDTQAYEDMYRVIQQDIDMLMQWRDRFREVMERKALNREYEEAERLRSVLFYTLLKTAKYRFADYLEVVEFEKKPEDKFYAPRKHYLKPVVEAYQKLADGELDFLSISLPKRAGKSQSGINFVNWLSGKNPNKSSLVEGTGDALITSFYNGCLEYLQTPNDYNFYDIFPDVKLSQTNADTKIINLDKKSRFPTIMCRSIDSRQVGLSEATNLLYLDDCVEGREEAKNRRRLDDKWEIISGDIIGRALEGTPIVICGTRYSLYDPIGRLQEHATKQGWRWKAIEIPALNENDESNYKYYNPKTQNWTFTTEYFKEQRQLITKEQFESEFQQQPFEAKGLLFPEEELNRFYELPIDKEPDSIVAVCDTAEKGEDYTSLPIAALYGDEVYIVDVVFDDSPPDITKPEIVKKLIQWNVSQVMFESNNAGEYYARDIDEMVKREKGRISIKTKRTITNKQTRIEFASDNIKRHFYFLDKSKYERGSQYWTFMNQLITHTRTGKVLHDDAADSLSLLENELKRIVTPVVEVFQRPF